MASPTGNVINTTSIQEYRDAAINWGWKAVAAGAITIGLAVFLGVDFNNLHSTGVGLTAGAIGVAFIGTAIMGGIAEVNRRKMREWQAALSEVFMQEEGASPPPPPTHQNAYVSEEAEHEPLPPAPQPAAPQPSAPEPSSNEQVPAPAPQAPPPQPAPIQNGPDLGVSIRVYSFGEALKSIVNHLRQKEVNQRAIREIIQGMQPVDARNFILELQCMMNDLKPYLDADATEKNDILKNMIEQKLHLQYGLDSHLRYFHASDHLVQNKNNQWIIQEICNKFSGPRQIDAEIILKPFRVAEA